MASLNLAWASVSHEAVARGFIPGSLLDKLAPSASSSQTRHDKSQRRKRLGLEWQRPPPFEQVLPLLLELDLSLGKKEV